MESRIETQGPLQGLSNLSHNWGGVYHSTNFISQTLEVAGTLVANTLKLSSPKILTILCDEVFSGGWAILVTIEAQSMAVLDIQLLDKALTAAAWEERFELLAQNNVVIGEIIKDQGVAMQSATGVLPHSTVVIADAFHAIPKRLGTYHSQLTRQINNCLTQEAKIIAKIAGAASEKMRHKQQAKLEVVRTKKAQLIDLLDWFQQAYFLLLSQLRPFTSKGIPRDKQVAEQHIEFALDVLELLPLNDITKNVKHIRKLLQSGELLSFMDKVPALYEAWTTKLGTNTSWLWMLYWLWWKKSSQTHSAKVQTKAKEEALAAEELLKEYYGDKPIYFEKTRVELFAALDTIVQASSLVETFNSILKPFINSSRGQLTQSMLNLVMFFHNHRVFHKRCKRGGKAPIEILTGCRLDKHWLDLLMDNIHAAFVKHQTTSLKQLHRIVCNKKSGQQKAKVRPLEDHHSGDDLVTMVA